MRLKVALNKCLIYECGTGEITHLIEVRLPD